MPPGRIAPRATKASAPGRPEADLPAFCIGSKAATGIHAANDAEIEGFHVPAQERGFERGLRGCAEQGGKILTVHSVKATAMVLGHIERALPADRGRVVLHWFTGTTAEARCAVALGCYFSINAEMLRSPKHRKLVGELPTDRLLTETEGPSSSVMAGPSGRAM